MFCHFFIWCLGSGVVLDCIDYWSLPLSCFYIKKYKEHNDLIVVCLNLEISALGNNIDEYRIRSADHDLHALPRNLRMPCVKGIYLSKALTCMNFSWIKRKLYFYQGDGYLWPYCCMNILYISHRSLYAPTNSFWAICGILICLLGLLPGLKPFAILWHGGWTLDKTSCMNINCDYLTIKFLKYFLQNVQISGGKILFLVIFAYERFKVKMKNCK